jgi:phosphoribosylformimino-5-aminoimidazole carboxamide ribotide isomerase
MLVIPAIDLRGGKTVRAGQSGTSDDAVFDADPVERAREFVKLGAKRLHVIDLDSAFGAGENHGAIAQVCRAVDVPVQTGGGIRTLEHAQARIDAGAAYIIIGTLLVEDERVARNIIGQLGEKSIAGIDARGSRVLVRGWHESTPVDRDALVRRVAQWGVPRVIFTEIGRDDLGFDMDALRSVASAAQVDVTVSGGARRVDDLRALKSEAPANVDSVVIGSGVYGSLDLAQAIAAVA